MRLLALRELRRQAPAAAGMFGLGVLTLLLMLGSTLVFDQQQRGAGLLEAVFLIVAVGTPWLLSVTAVAPDQETGAEAFLVTMPVGRRRLALMRTGVALALSLSVIATTAVMCVMAQPLFQNEVLGVIDRSRRIGLVLSALAAGGVLFTAGALATVLVRQTLVAFVISPALVLGPGLLFVWTSDEVFRIPERVTIPVLAVTLPLLLLAAAWRGYIRPTRELGWRRPMRFVAGLTGALFVIGAGLTTTAFAVDRLVPGHQPRDAMRAPNGAAAAVSIEAYSRLSRRGGQRENENRTLVFRAGSVDRPVELAAGHYPIAFSPQARSLLVGEHSSPSSLGLVDLETGALVTRARPSVVVTPLQRGATKSLTSDGLSALSSAEGLVPIMWHAGVPWLAGRQGLVRWDGAEQRRAPDGARLITVGGSRALFQDASGQVLLDLSGEAPTRLEPPVGMRPIEWRLLGIDGRWIVTLARASGGSCSLWVRDLQGSAAWRKVGLTLPETAVFGVGELWIEGRLISPPSVHFSVSPTSPFASVVVTVSLTPNGVPDSFPLRTVDLRSGETVVVTRKPGRGERRAWLPDGRLLTRQGAWDPALGRVTPSPSNLGQVAKGYQQLLLFDGHEAITWWKRIDLKSGVERPFVTLQNASYR